MTPKEYQAAAMRTNNSKSFADMMDNGVLGLCGEAGEVADILKKARFQGHALDRTKLIDELGDVEWYVSLICYALGITHEEVWTHNIEKLKKRYQNGFTAAESVGREEYRLTKEDVEGYAVTHPSVKPMLLKAKLQYVDGVNALVFDNEQQIAAKIIEGRVPDLTKWIEDGRGVKLTICVMCL